jgi:hypothetical protein
MLRVHHPPVFNCCVASACSSCRCPHAQYISGDALHSVRRHHALRQGQAHVPSVQVGVQPTKTASARVTHSATPQRSG